MDTVDSTNLTFQRSHNPIEVIIFSLTATSTPCCLFLIINGTILSILRSKPQFSESPRYVLLFNLVIADTMLITHAHTMYLMSVFQVIMWYPLCGVFTMFSNLVIQVSPMTLALMSIERYIAVCFPLRHSSIVTLRNTGFAILIIWAFSCVDVFIRILLLVQFPFHKLRSLLMPRDCNLLDMVLTPAIREYETATTYIQFVISGLVIGSSFIGIMNVARSASTDKASADKARKTLLLHMFQLSLTLISAMTMPMFVSAAKYRDQLLVRRLFVVIYIFAVLMPRCLSAVTYGLKDQSIRPILVSRLCCSVRLTVGTVGVQMTSERTVKVY